MNAPSLCNESEMIREELLQRCSKVCHEDILCTGATITQSHDEQPRNIRVVHAPENKRNLLSQSGTLNPR